LWFPFLFFSFCFCFFFFCFFADAALRNCVIPESALALLAAEPSPQALLESREVLREEGRSRQLFVFSNLHSAALHTPALPQESPSASATRRGVLLTQWYQQHYPQASFYHVNEMERYAQLHQPALLARCAWVEADRPSEALFPLHRSKAELEEELRQGRVKECRLYESCVEVSTGEEVVLTDRNRALPGDRIAVDSGGKVVGVLGRRQDQVLVGQIDKDGLLRANAVRLRLRGTPPTGRRLGVVVDCWPCHSRYPLGHIIKDLGDVNDQVAKQEGVLLQHQIRAQPFTPAQLAGLPAPDFVPALTPGREDLRHLPVCSVDPPGCTDIDDALHALALPDGQYEVGVHIADVSSYVKEDSDLDLEARQRSTTVYLVDRRIDMLPNVLSSNICSLRDVPRHALSVIWVMDAEGKIISTRFTQSLIRSRHSLTYGAAQERINNAALSDPVTESLRLLQRLAQHLRRRRLSRGALLLSSPEVKFVHADNNGEDVVDAELYQALESNSTVEEFMLLANICVANKIWSTFPALALLRRHAEPEPSRWRHLVAQLAAVNIHPQSTANADVAAALAHAPEMARVLVTRHMQQAVYVAAGSVAIEAYTHYGLAVPIYTHFTSPIRRYADLVVHRLLVAAIGQGPLPRLSVDRTVRLARHINHRHRMAQLAGRASAVLFAQQVLTQNGPRTLSATILGLIR
jgi:exosome complex exonuclease DIS3/RRP44